VQTGGPTETVVDTVGDDDTEQTARQARVQPSQALIFPGLLDRVSQSLSVSLGSDDSKSSNVIFGSISGGQSERLGSSWFSRPDSPILLSSTGRLREWKDSRAGFRVS